MKDPVNDYKKNGSEIIGNYVGAQVAVNRQNSPEVIFDRKIVQLGLNEAYAREFARPIIETKPVVEAEVLDMTTAKDQRKAKRLDRGKDDEPYVLGTQMTQTEFDDRNKRAAVREREKERDREPERKRERDRKKERDRHKDTTDKRKRRCC